MTSKKITYISVGSVAKSLPLVYLILGFIVGLISYIYLKINPSAIAPKIGFFEWLLAILIYAAIFCVVLSVLSILGAWIYNIISKKIGGIYINAGDDA